MSTPLTKPPLEDPASEREIFASEIAGVGFVHGNVVVTFASIRFEEPVADQTPKMRRVVTGRVALTNNAAGQLLKHLQNLAAQIEAAVAAAAKDKQKGASKNSVFDRSV